VPHARQHLCAAFERLEPHLANGTELVFVCAARFDLIQQLQDARVVGEGIAVGVDAAHLSRCAERMVELAPIVAGLMIMIGQQPVINGNALRADDLFDLLAYLQVVGRPLRVQEAFVHDIAHQRGRERIGDSQLRLDVLLVDELRALEIGERTLKLRGVADQAFEDAAPEQRADDRRNLEHVALLDAEMVDAGEQQAAQAARQVDALDGLHLPPDAGRILLHESLIDQRVDQLPRIIGITLSFFDEQGRRGIRQRAPAEHLLDQRTGLAGRERRQVNRGQPVRVFGLDIMAELPDRRGALGPKARQPQHWRAFADGQAVLEQFQRTGVRELQVGKRHDQRAALRQGFHPTVDRAENLLLQSLGLEIRDAPGLGAFDGQRQQHRQVRVVALDIIAP